MINGIFLDPRIWKIDYLTNPFWKPNLFGINIDVHLDAFNIPKIGIDPKYKFAIVTELWEIPMRKTLSYLRKKGIKIFLVPREISKTKAHQGIMFFEEKFNYNGEYFFTPDYIFAPGQQYSSVWDGKEIPKKIIGYPRYEVYLKPELLRTKAEARKRHGIDQNKKIIFFPSYPAIYIQTVNNKNIYTFLDKDLENTMYQLEQYAINNQKEVQVIVKLHPYSQKCYDKKTGSGKEVFGLLKKYYESPSSYLKVIGDSRLDSTISRDMIISTDFVVGSISMMMLEAALTNKPMFNIRLEQECKLNDMISYENNMITAYKPDDIIINLNNMILHPDKYKVDTSFVNHYLYKVDGKFCERLCNEIKLLI